MRITQQQLKALQQKQTSSAMTERTIATLAKREQVYGELEITNIERMLPEIGEKK